LAAVVGYAGDVGGKLNVFVGVGLVYCQVVDGGELEADCGVAVDVGEFFQSFFGALQGTFGSCSPMWG
jgi:hypothetical protein